MASPPNRRPLNELINTDEAAWDLVQSWFAGATNSIEVLPRSEFASEVLFNIQVTTKSPLGAVAHSSGGFLVDSGWLRILGSGHPRLPRRIDQWNEGRTISNGDPIHHYFLVADDILGGFFAIVGGDLAGDPGTVNYYAPDSLAWESLGMGYSGFLQWCCSGDIQKFYESLRWPSWQAEAAALAGDSGLLVYPFLCTQGPAISERHRGAVPMHELYGLFVEELPRQLGAQ